MIVNNEFIRIEITNRCNLQCKDCFSLANQRQHSDLSREKIVNVAKSFKKLGGNTILLTGGECTLVNELESILYELKSLDYNVDIFTNGSIWNENELLKNKAYIDKIYVSLDDEKTYDKKGHSECRSRTLSFIKLLTNLGYNYCIESIVDQSNYNTLSWIADLVDEYKVKEWIVGSKYIGWKNTLSESQELELLNSIEYLTEKLDYKVLIRSNIISKEQFRYSDELLDNLFSPYVLLDGTIKPFFVLDNNYYDLININELIKTEYPMLRNLKKLEVLKSFVEARISERKCWDFTELIYQGMEYYERV